MVSTINKETEHTCPFCSVYPGQYHSELCSDRHKDLVVEQKRRTDMVEKFLTRYKNVLHEKSLRDLLVLFYEECVLLSEVEEDETKTIS